MVEIKTAGEIEAIAAAGSITAQALAAARAAANVGVTLLELDAVAAEVISAAGASALDCFFSNAGIAFMRYAMASDTTNSRSVNLFS